MAERESITRASGLFGSWTAARAAKLGEEAFQVAAHMALQERDPAHWPDGDQFARDVVQVFEALLMARMWPKADQWAVERLAEVPVGFRPGYEAGRLRREHAKGQGCCCVDVAVGGRSEAQGGGEAPLQSGGPN